MPRYAVFAFLVGLLLVGWQCSLSQPATLAWSSSRRELVRSGRANPVWQIVYCGQDTAAYARVAHDIAQAAPQGKQFSVCSCTDVVVDSLGRYPLVLIGSTWPAAWQPLLNQLPYLQLEEGRFQFQQENYTSATDLLKLLYVPNPWNDRLPLHLFHANADRTLLEHLTQHYAGEWNSLLWTSWAFELYRDGQVERLGHFATPDWRIDSTESFRFHTKVFPLRASIAGRLLSVDGATPLRLDSLQQVIEDRRHRVADFLGVVDLPPVDFYCYPSVEHLGLRRQDMRYAQADAVGHTVHLVDNDYFRGSEAAEEVRVWLRSELGSPATLALEDGLVRYFAGSRAGHSYRYWARLLWQSDNLPTLTELTTTDSYEQESPLVREITAAALADFLLNHWGADSLRRQYGSWVPSVAELTDMQPAFDQFVALYPAATLARQATPDRLLRGFTFAHEGYRVYNGYGSQLAVTALDSLGGLGVDALAIVPYSFMRNAQRVAPIPVVRRAGTENDEAVLFAHFETQRRGWYSLLKPQLWVSGAWPGEVDFSTDADWVTFFEHYQRWLRHYALLSQMYQVDALCVGTELVRASLRHPERWRQLIGRVRGLYGGTLTYAANWGEEFEQFSFWDALDVVGLNAYYPLHPDTTATDAQLQAGALAIVDRAAAISRRVGRPLWFTEIGYRSASASWVSPHAEPGERAAAPADQARAYRALLAALDQRPGVVQGIFWWKWPSYLHHDDYGGRDYHPYQQPAASVLRDWYQRRHP